LANLPEENHENLKGQDGGCVLSEENHEDLTALEGGCVSLTLEGSAYWQISLRKITRILLHFRKDICTHILKTFILEILPEKIYGNIRVVEGVCVPCDVILLILREKNRENLRALEVGCVYRHLKNVYTGNYLRKVIRISRARREAVFTETLRKLCYSPS
jgi:hypothetical protein